MNKQPLIAAALSLSALFVSFNTQAHSHVKFTIAIPHLQYSRTVYRMIMSVT